MMSMDGKADALIGNTIDGKYRIESKLGAGGMGIVYLSTRLMIGDTVAVKILHAQQVSDPQAIERFRREAQAAARLKHQNVVAIYDFGVSNDGLVYLVMELAEGQSLRDIIKQQGHVTPSVAAEIMSQVCVALEAAHRQNIVHRDMKPDNIIVAVTNTGLRAKVLDFGIAKMRDLTASNLTQTGSVIGTPHYMSPEHCMGEELDHRSDIYSLGIVLFEMLAGVVPFNSPTPTAVAVQHVNQAPPSLRVLNASISPAVEAVVMHALAKRREARPQTAIQLAQELMAAVQSRPLTPHGGPMPVSPFYPTPASTTPAANPVTGTELAATIQMTIPPVDSGAQTAAPAKNRLPLKLGVAAVIMMAVIIVVLLIWAGQRSSPTNKQTNSGTTEKTGTFAINPQFDSAESFSEGLAVVRVGGKYGYIDKTGKLAIIPQFDSAESFSEGLAEIGIRSRFGYIDKTGTMVLTPQFNAVGPVCRFHEGLAAVVLGGDYTGRMGYIDKTGKVVVTPQFDSADSFSEGLALVRIGDFKTGKWGYIDKTGKMVVNPQFSSVVVSEDAVEIGAQEFSEGLAAVRVGADKTRKWGYIDKTGTMVITPQFDSVDSFSEGFALVRIDDYKTKTRRMGYIDNTGKMVLTVPFDSAGSFSEGLASVWIRDEKTGKWGYIDKTGELVVTPQFDWTLGFSEGLAAVRIGDSKTGKWGYIDKTGKMVVGPQFDSTAGFSEGLALVRIGDSKTGKWGYIYR